MYNPVIETKSFRKDLDNILQDMRVREVSHDGEVVTTRGSRERSLAITKVQEAIMWLGMDLKAMREEGLNDDPNPYPNGYTENNTIDPPSGVKL